MRSRTTGPFWRLFDALPDDVQARARIAYAHWLANHAHPSIAFKRVSRSEPIHSARIGRAHRYLGMLQDDTVTRFWIGHHDDYERLLG